MTQKQNNIFFGGLNELRAIAALGVIFHHLELYNHRDRLLSIYNVKISAINYFISHLGKNCVYVFFVLSGFLITYLLLHEKEQTNKIEIRHFYLRRILRIWPLYYIIILISFCLIPSIDS
jgi:peptidoglycan/LPS O-acetylase OafA/YrhL